MDFTFELATEKDDADLRRLLATNAMPGRITVTFEREPNYLFGCPTMGHFWQVLIARHPPAGDLGASSDLVAVICRATQPRFVNGQAHEIGYLGQLRVDSSYRGGWALLEGIAHLRDLHADGRTTHYLAAISDENATALGVLVEHPRRSFPRLHEIAHLHTLGIIVRRNKPPVAWPDQIEWGRPQVSDEIAAFLQRCGAARQFFPLYTRDDLLGKSALLRDCHIEDLAVARQDGEIVGTAGLWDQEGFKQTVVQGYGGALRWLRPLYNLGVPLLGAQPLPGIGEHIRSAYVSLICTADGMDNGAAVFRALLRQVYNRAAERGYAHLMIGLAENDPLLPVAKEYAHIAYYSRLYLAAWNDAPDLALDERVPYIEIAAL